MIYRQDIQDLDYACSDTVRFDIHNLCNMPKMYSVEVRKSGDINKIDYSFSNKSEKVIEVTIPTVKQEDIIFVSVRELP